MWVTLFFVLFRVLAKKFKKKARAKAVGESRSKKRKLLLLSRVLYTNGATTRGSVEREERGVRGAERERERERERSKNDAIVK